MPQFLSKSRFLRLAAILVIGGSLGPGWAREPAGASGAGSLNRAVEQSLPAIRPATTPSAVTETGGVAGAVINLPSPIGQFAVHAPRLRDPLMTLLHERFYGKQRLTAAELDAAKTAIWALFRRGGTLAHVSLSVIALSAEQGGSRIDVDITEMRVRNLRVEQEGGGPVAADVLESIVRDVRGDLARGEVFDLDSLDAKLKRRLYLNDAPVRALIEPVDAGQIDIRILVGTPRPAPASSLLQYDNTGDWTFGKDRLTAGVSQEGLLRPGDRADALILKTLDIGSLQSRGMGYGRLAYEVPVVALGARASLWLSDLDYEAAKGVAETANASGDLIEIGTGLARPLFFGRDLTVVGRAELLQKRAQDWLLDGVETDDKTDVAGRVRLDVDYRPAPTRIFTGNLTVTSGRLDLSANPSGLAQDQAGPRSNGGFTKLEFGVSWQSRLDNEQKFDTRVSLFGQWADKNLDSMEKMSLGGPSGLRGFGASEAPGDEGYIANFEAGYRIYPWLRAAAFYDVGGIVRNESPYLTSDSEPNRYVLQDAGVALEVSFRAVDASLSFSQQIGHNPGLSANGLDADNTTQRYRVFASLTYRD